MHHAVKPVMSFPFLLSLVLSLAGQAPGAAERRALAYLDREVPRWFTANQCYSCHNNGDAARALYLAIRLAYAVRPEALADTTRWLARPDGWDDNKGEPAFSDKGLARLQFAAALVDAMDAKQVQDRKVLIRAAELIAEGQRKDGSWQVDAEGTIGSPATYGPFLATYQARRVLAQADPKRFGPAIARADAWFRQAKVETVLDAAALLLALDGKQGPAVEEQRRHCLTLIRQGEAKSGGWGPYVHSPPEPFDTAVVLLALLRLGERPDLQPMRQRGRVYLIRTQQADGTWPETTRPAGSVSYAQRLSTAGWATLALLATRSRPE
jgi:hypothetical protein